MSSQCLIRSKYVVFSGVLTVDIFSSEYIFVNGTPNGYVTASMDYYGGRWAIIRLIEASDRNINGTGARVNGWGIGLNAFLSFESFLGGDINFLVAVYGEIAEPILFQMGQLSELSVMAHSYAN